MIGARVKQGAEWMSMMGTRGLVACQSVVMPD